MKVKLIRHNSTGIDEPNDLTYPFKLNGSFRPPEFMQVANVFLYGNEEFTAIGKTREDLEDFITKNELRSHPRLVKLTITTNE